MLIVKKSASGKLPDALQLKTSTWDLAHPPTNAKVDKARIRAVTISDGPLLPALILSDVRSEAATHVFIFDFKKIFVALHSTLLIRFLPYS